jgi:hypothetical protein
MKKIFICVICLFAMVSGCTYNFYETPDKETIVVFDDHEGDENDEPTSTAVGAGGSVTEDPDGAGGAGGEEAIGGGGATGGSDAAGGAGGGDAGAEKDCNPDVLIELLHHMDTFFTVGHEGVETLTIRITASDCQDLLVWWLRFYLVNVYSANEGHAFCEGECSTPANWNFRNPRVVDQYGKIYMGPGSFSMLSYNDDIAGFDGEDPFVVKKGTAVTLTMLLDIADPLSTSIIGNQYTVNFNGSGTNSGEPHLPYEIHTHYYQDLQARITIFNK